MHPERIPRRAPEVYCQNGKLAGATRSTNDHIVIGMLQTEENSRNQAVSHRGPPGHRGCPGEPRGFLGEKLRWVCPPTVFSAPPPVVV